ncbi:Na+/H+ antiporter NhaC family protein [Limosilactobacillus mucosae]|uniref:Na+/H+ antiporter NhaC family protein n=1 Tax=Limosilactobacillus mucosae TaxID=97478 RepID=A0AAJ1HTF0_LIMMU|nr:Na+/H+ antiporter NhaC family protein [Limosilactobacillus mucosae]MDC2829149.1 Na+/H+ antiporter NhaC family protein [Limosilactobacillus mucosae]MDC2837732.1 Na+/H+ antiporter NhaC family protein [Limosilactobacillus mucosae]MDC2848686.1 Na+/H+ antiporter NhaC family protein [Limosilactobacillus mucosae]MDC2853132.1 Na+/H+ antiporter NhaC family protein [Limosilactobacillus mucosae]
MTKKIKFKESVAILLIMLIVLGCGVIGFGLSPQVPVLTVIAFLVFWLAIRRVSWDDIMKGITEGISTAIIPIFIFILIGTLIAVWIQAGIIPSLMVLGFHLISARFFVPSVFIVCSLVGLAIGSGFTTVSTVGIALFGIGSTLGVNPALTAGAIISGAVFGDKMSPLSDSTNLASAVAEDDLFDHIKNMMWSTIPAFLVSLVVFFFLGQSNKGTSLASIASVNAVLTKYFAVSWWAALPIILMFVCAWKKVPAIPTLFLNIVLSTIMIFINNPHLAIAKFATLIESGFVSKTGNKAVDALLTRGGISSMMGTVSLIIMTLALVARLSKPGRLITATICAGIGVNLFVGEQYLSVILPGNAFKPAFKRIGLSPLALSRTLEDGGSVINYLIPWGVAGSFVASTLGVPVLEFLPFTLFSLMSPVFSILSGFTGIGLKWQPGHGPKPQKA